MYLAFAHNYLNAQYLMIGTVLVDQRDNKRYKTIEIDNKLWMAENLNYNGSDIGQILGSCYDDNADNCNIYGRMYSISEMENYQLCPDGWRIATDWDWMIKSISPLGSCKVQRKNRP